MKKGIFIGLAVLLVFSTLITTAFAGGRYYTSRHYYPRHYDYSHRSYHHHSYRADRIWAGLGIGLLTGAVIGTIVSSPPRQPAVVYTAPPRIYTSPPQVIVQQQPVYIASERVYSSEPELVLRRVTATAELLNVRSGPGLDTPIVGQVRQDQILDVIGAAPDWLYIKTELGNYGWVMTRFTRESDHPVG